MKTNITSIFAAATLVLFTASCANEETTKQDANQETAAGTNFVGGSAVKTRTSLDVTLPGGSTVDYFWEPSDKIWTNDGATGTAQITAKSATANFRMSKAYNTPTVDVYYPGVNATAYNQVTIATSQTQTAPNSTKHLGEAGDCGVATAHQQSDKSYKFDLDHKAAYLCLLPRMSNKLVSTYITQVKITSDNNIAGTYTLTKTGLTGSGSSNTITLTTPGDGTLVPGPYDYWNGPTTVPSPGFPLNNAATSQSTNAMYVVIAPGTHALTIEYTIYDTMTNHGGTITKTIASTAYAENTVYPITANIKVTEYPGNGYYMWDAADGEHYWKGHEWNKPSYTAGVDQPTVNNTTGSASPQNNSDPRYWSESYPGFGVSNPAIHSCASLPNANEMSWYCMFGDPRWDADKLWATMGHLYKGGMWFRKKSVLIADGHYDTEKSADGSTDMRTTFKSYSNNNSSIQSGLPSAADANKYFYLPALGFHDFSGVLYEVGNYGFYWSSSANPEYNSTAYNLNFFSGGIGVSSGNRNYGLRVGALE
ncbi:MAG: hypothetical protein ACTTJL_03335 [Hoylesella enoeca]|uniref:hypothetical protein n=1 Tax=Hoylesella enoeca TaxID=76123 RepID=UPI003FA142C8